jgi:hypothetical protein
MVWYTVEQCVFLYELYVKCVSAGKCQRKFHHKFPGNPSITCILLIKSGLSSPGVNSGTFSGGFQPT